MIIVGNAVPNRPRLLRYHPSRTPSFLPVLVLLRPLLYTLGPDATLVVGASLA